MIEQTFTATGLTCEHCVNAVQEEIGALRGVTAVAVELNAGGSSTVRVTSTDSLTDEQVVAALDEAGDYLLA